jgi:precorrin-6B methylase 2
MTAVTFCLAFIFLLLGDRAVYGQGLRGGSFGGGRSSGGGWTQGPAAPSRQAAPPVQRSAANPVPASRAGPSLHANPFSRQPSWAHPAPVFRAPILSSKPLVVVPGAPWAGLRWRGRPHGHRPHYPVYPGAVIYGVPVYDSTTVITQVAPGVVQQERRSIEDSAPEVSSRNPDSLAPFDPTPQEIVERMLALAGVKKGDVVYDLGAGDGRILIAAAKKYGARAVGFETDPGLVKLARENARNAGVEKLVEIREQNFLSADLSRASVVTLYLSYDGNLAVRDQLLTQLRPGTRVVSYTFDMGDWPAKIAEAYRDKAGNAHALYLWEITAQALARHDSEPMLQPQPNRGGPLIIEVR